MAAVAVVSSRLTLDLMKLFTRESMSAGVEFRCAERS